MANDITHQGWRPLALQFDNHRMRALWYLKALLQYPDKYRTEVEAFLKEPPLDGEAVLAARIAEMAKSVVPAAPPRQFMEDSPQDVQIRIEVTSSHTDAGASLFARGIAAILSRLGMRRVVFDSNLPIQECLDLEDIATIEDTILSRVSMTVKGWEPEREKVVTSGVIYTAKDDTYSRDLAVVSVRYYDGCDESTYFVKQSPDGSFVNTLSLTEAKLFTPDQARDFLDSLKNSPIMLKLYRNAVLTAERLGHFGDLKIFNNRTKQQ